VAPSLLLPPIVATDPPGSSTTGDDQSRLPHDEPLGASGAETTGRGLSNRCAMVHKVNPDTRSGAPSKSRRWRYETIWHVL